MLGKSPNQNTPQSNLFRPLLASFINLEDALVVLGQKIKWNTIEANLANLYSPNGAPSKPIRLMAGLLILKQMFNKSDEVIVEEWKQNAYYQYFTGCIYFEWELPCDSSDLVHFRKRIGEKGVLEIMKMSQELHSEKIKASSEIIVDTTVQEKNITFPTDQKLALKIIEKTIKFATQNEIKLKQTFAKELKKLKIDVRFSTHPKRRKKATKARKRIKTIAAILIREVDRKAVDGKFKESKKIYLKVLNQTRTSKDKIYSLHEPQVACIAKGKAHKSYEFGSKVSITMIPGSNVILNVKNFEGNPHDSTTLAGVIKELDNEIKSNIKYAIVDRGYRGNTKIENINIVIPNTKADENKSEEFKKNKSRQCKSRAAIEPIISHLKFDCRMARNFLKGMIGDKINAILAGAAFNFRIALKEIKDKICVLIFELINLPIIKKFNLLFLGTYEKELTF